jgi:LPS sulfotransferase NodH
VSPQGGEVLASGAAGADAGPAAVRFVVLAAPRTGSNWLCTLLDSHPEVLCHHEIFNPAGLHYARSLRGGGFDLGTAAERDRNPEGVLERVWRESRGHRAVGFKLNRGQDERVFRAVLADTGVRKLLLRRANRVRAYVSERIAEQTGRWESYPESPRGEAGPARVTVEAAALRAGVARNERYYAALGETLGASGQGWLELTYEKLDGAEERGRALRFLGVTDRPELLAGATRRQNPEPLRELIANFDELAAELAGSDLAAELHAGGR